MTPMMEQYFEIKKQYEDYLLFYRLGDFYEMFFDDAILASRELELTLTGRDCGEAERAPMCGVPYHSAEGYIGKLIEKGYRVAICEQTEDPAKAVGIVKREVIRVVTPGTLIETDLLNESKNNYLCAVCLGESECGVAFADISTAQIFATAFKGDSVFERLKNELGTYSPSEVLCNVNDKKLGDVAEFIKQRLGAMLNANLPSKFEQKEAEQKVRAQFSDRLREGDEDNKPLIRALGGLLSYIEETQKSDISYIKELNIYSDGQYMEMDINTRRNLELTETLRTKEKKGSLLWVLDRTKTAAGARLLRQWMEHPLIKPGAIYSRQNAVEELYNSYIMREELGVLLDGVLDLERLATKIVYGTAGGKDLRAVCSTVAVLPEIKRLISNAHSDELCRIHDELETLDDIYIKINSAICENPPFSVREGGIIAEGYNSDLDSLRAIMKDGKGYIEQIAEREREETGIKTLKIAYNKVFGYYIEVTKSLVSQVPDRYIRKQTLSGCERYITDELKNVEATVLGAGDRANSLEYELFCEVRSFVADNSHRLQAVAALLSRLDAYYSLATVAIDNQYVRPQVHTLDEIDIKGGRHPVVELFVKDKYFVPNNTFLNNDYRLLIITGPNMAGKSTYMRQVAIITLMAQIGSFVPAQSANIGIVDKLFTRVGASDDLASGQSTYMLEMNEVAYILRNATKKSLIIYDEVGRGTSTFDGMSVARAIIEYTAGKRIGAKTLFATHYHELTAMEGEVKGVHNFHVAAYKRGDTVKFLHEIRKGAADESYGIEVAKLAGVPDEVIKRAREVLRDVERMTKDFAESKKSGDDSPAITIEDISREMIINELLNIDLNSTSPFEAMSLLYDLQKRLREFSV